MTNVIMNKETIRIGLDQTVDIGEFHLVVGYNVDEITEIDQDMSKTIETTLERTLQRNVRTNQMYRGQNYRGGHTGSYRNENYERGRSRSRERQSPENNRRNDRSCSSRSRSVS